MAFYAADGSWNVTVVDGTSLVPRQAANGSTNVVLSSVSGGVGRFHPCGALRVEVATGTNGVGRHAASGALLVSESGLYNAQKVTVVSGSFISWLSDFQAPSNDLPVAVLGFTTSQYYDGAETPVASLMVEDTVLGNPIDLAGSISAAGMVTSAGNQPMFSASLVALSSPGHTFVIEFDNVSANNYKPFYGDTDFGTTFFQVNTEDVTSPRTIILGADVIATPAEVVNAITDNAVNRVAFTIPSSGNPSISANGSAIQTATVSGPIVPFEYVAIGQLGVGGRIRFMAIYGAQPNGDLPTLSTVS